MATNLYPPFSSSSTNYSYWTATSDYFLTQRCYSRSTYYVMSNTVDFNDESTYTYSIYVKSSAGNALFVFSGGGVKTIIQAGGAPAEISNDQCTFTLPNANTWYRIYVTYTSNVGILSGGGVSPRTEATNTISAPMLETGSTLHDFVPYGEESLPWVMVGDDPMPWTSPKYYAPSDFIEPFGAYLFRIGDGDIVPTFQPTPTYEPSDFIEPYPSSLWRVESVNSEKPFHLLMPDMVTYDPTPPPPPPPPPAPTIDPVEFYDEYNAEYLSALRQKHRRYKVRLELLGYYENVVGEITRDLSRGASGQITINNEQITRRSCNLSLINVGKNYLPSPDNPIWFNRKFKLWIGIVTGKHTYWWSYGVFFTVKATCDGNTVNIQGVDKGGALDGTIKTGMLDAENIIKRGTTLTNLVKDTLMWNEFSSPYLRHNTGASSYPVDPIKPIVDTKFDSIITQADITINANDYISTLFSSIAEGYGADAYYNTNGHFVFQTMADGNRIDGYRFMARQWDFSDQDEMYSNASIEFNLDGYNVVTVYTNESTLENVSYTATNNNPTSPLRIDMAGIRRMADVEIPYVNVAQDEMENRCKAYADYLLMKEAMDGQSITFTSPIIPHLDVNRTIGITDKRLNLDDATFIINSITMPLSAESMTINATQMEWLSDDIEGSAV